MQFLLRLTNNNEKVKEWSTAQWKLFPTKMGMNE